LLVVLAAEKRETQWLADWRGSLTWVALLLMCFASFFTNLTHDTGAHFRQDTWVMLVALTVVTGAALVASFLRAAPQTLLQPEPVPSTPEPCPEPSSSSTTS